MASKYTLKDLPTSGSYTYKGIVYPKWDVDGLRVSNNQLWDAMGMNHPPFAPNPEVDNPDWKTIEHDCIIWTLDTAPIDEICEIASQQGGSGTPEKIIADVEKRIVRFNGLVNALKAWHTGLDKMDGATGELWNWLPMSMLPSATEEEWYKDCLCERIDPYIGSRYDLQPEADMTKIFAGDAEEIRRLDVWARKRAQEIYDGCREVDAELVKERAEKDAKRIKEELERKDRILRGEKQVGTAFFAVYSTPSGERGYYYQLDDVSECDQFLDYDGKEVKLLRVYQMFREDHETYFSEISVADAVEIATGIEEYFHSKENY